MEADTSWTIDPQEFHFGSCSGARLGNIVQDPQGDNPPQMKLVGDRPRMLTYHAGGNNCDFGAAVADCIYPLPTSWITRSYPPEYPDPAGPCIARVEGSNRYINTPGNGSGEGLYYDELRTLQDLLGQSAVKDNPDFKLYVLGYAHFFNTNDNFCSQTSFAPAASLGGNPPKLSQRLRIDINDAVDRANKVIEKVVNDVGDPRVKYIRISHEFDHHRFCEDDHDSKNAQWYNPDVWLWNLNFPSNDPPEGDSRAMDVWISSEMAKFFMENPNVQILSGSGDSGGGGGNTWTQRPFHPKKGGTEAIKKLIIDQARRDQISGVRQATANPPTGPPGVYVCNESGCSPESPPCCANGTC